MADHGLGPSRTTAVATAQPLPTSGTATGVEGVLPGRPFPSMTTRPASA